MIWFKKFSASAVRLSCGCKRRLECRRRRAADPPRTSRATQTTRRFFAEPSFSFRVRRVNFHTRGSGSRRTAVPPSGEAITTRAITSEAITTEAFTLRQRQGVIIGGSSIRMTRGRESARFKAALTLLLPRPTISIETVETMPHLCPGAK